MDSAEARLNALFLELDSPHQVNHVSREDGKEMTLIYGKEVYGKEAMVIARVLKPPRDNYIRVDAFGLNPLTERGHINYVEDHKLPGIIKTLLEE